MAFRLPAPQHHRNPRVPDPVLRALVARQTCIDNPSKQAKIKQALRKDTFSIDFELFDSVACEWKPKTCSHNVWELLENIHISLGDSDKTTRLIKDSMEKITRRSSSQIYFACAMACFNGYDFTTRIHAELLKIHGEVGKHSLQKLFKDTLRRCPEKGIFTDRFNKRCFTAKDKRAKAEAKLQRLTHVSNKLKLRLPKKKFEVKLASKLGPLTAKNAKLYLRQAYLDGRSVPCLTGPGSVMGPGAESCASAIAGFSSTRTSNTKVGIPISKYLATYASSHFLRRGAWPQVL